MIHPNGKPFASQLAVARSARLALVASLAVLAGCFALALHPPPAVAQSAFEEQYELDLGGSAPTPSSGAEQAPSGEPAAPWEASAIGGSLGNADGVGVRSPRTSPPEGLSAAASGELPVAGYPFTPFLLLLLALLLGGLAVRAGLTVRERLRGRGPGPPSGAR